MTTTKTTQTALALAGLCLAGAALAAAPAWAGPPRPADALLATAVNLNFDFSNPGAVTASVSGKQATQAQYYVLDINSPGQVRFTLGVNPGGAGLLSLYNTAVTSSQLDDGQGVYSQVVLFGAPFGPSGPVGESLGRYYAVYNPGSTDGAFSFSVAVVNGPPLASVLPDAAFPNYQAPPPPVTPPPPAAVPEAAPAWLLLAGLLPLGLAAARRRAR